jgi:succinate dehydrogenase / fumarate reductase, cytochrome b subunit
VLPNGVPVTEVRDALMVGRSSKGGLVRRPLSPHLQVYRWPISMALSISHRITGVGLGIGTLLLTWWLIAAAVSDSAFATAQGFFGSGFGIFLLFCWAAALLFHLVTGTRHLFWDIGLGFGRWADRRSDWPSYRQTGWAAVAVTVILTLAAWIIGMLVR